MGYTITQEPGLMAGTGQAIVFVAYDTETANIYPDGDEDVFKYRYVCDIYIDSGDGSVRVARLKQLPNAQSRGVFDVSKIVNSFLYPTKVNQGSTTTPIHLLPLNDTGDPFSHNDSSLESVICKFGYETATSLITTPSVTPDVATEDVVYCIQASIPIISTSPNGNNALGNYIPNGDAKRFLTHMPDYTIDKEAISVSNNEWRTMAFFNESTLCQINRLYVQIYNSSDVLLNTSNYYFTNSVANGGAIPASEATTDAKRLLYVGIGVKNLNTQSLHTDMRISNHPTASYYLVFGANSSNAQKTTKYRFNLSGNDCVFPMLEFCWKNRLGQWDYYTFRKKDTLETGIARTSMKRPVGRFNSTLYTEDYWNRGTETLDTIATYRGKANTDYVGEKTAQWLESLFTSNDVYIIKTDGDVFTSETTISPDAPVCIPVIIKSASYQRKTHINDKCQIQYTIDYEYSNNERTAI